MAWRSGPFTEPRLLLCEGPDDCAFFRRLIQVRGIPKFHIADTSTPDNEAAGNSGFGRALLAAAFNANYASIRTIVVVADGDGDPAASFASVCDQVQVAGFPRPQTSGTPTIGRPAVTVIMVPTNGEPGNLESFCVPAADSENQQIAQHVRTFAALIRTENWAPGRAGKLHLRASLAARHARDPFIFLGKVFREYPDLIPLSHSSF